MYWLVNEWMSKTDNVLCIKASATSYSRDSDCWIKLWHHVNIWHQRHSCLHNQCFLENHRNNNSMAIFHSHQSWIKWLSSCKRDFVCANSCAFVLFGIAIRAGGLPRWPSRLRHCHGLLAVSHHRPGKNPGLGKLESFQWIWVRQWYPLGTPISSTSYNWRVTT